MPGPTSSQLNGSLVLAQASGVQVTVTVTCSRTGDSRIRLAQLCLIALSTPPSQSRSVKVQLCRTRQGNAATAVITTKGHAVKS